MSSGLILLLPLEDAAAEVADPVVAAADEELPAPEGTGPDVPPTGGPEGMTELLVPAAADANAASVSVF